jgi:hypothetical protein
MALTRYSFQEPQLPHFTTISTPADIAGEFDEGKSIKATF